MKDDEAEKTPDNDEQKNEERRTRILRLVCFVLFGVFAAGAVGCVIAYAVTRADILFIPAALSAIVALLAFTYARVLSR